MRRFLQRVRHGLCALGAVACLATAVMWGRSYWVRDYGWFVQPWTRDDASGQARCLWLNPESEAGQLSFTWRVIARGEWATTALAGRRTFYARFPSARTHLGAWASPPAPWERLGFGLTHPGLGNTCVYLPYWFVAAALAVPLVLAAGRRRTARRRADGHRCLACGYDLRATPDRCPECGTVVLSKAAT